MKTFLIVLVAALLIVIIAVPNTRPLASASAKATADTLRQLEGEFMKAYYADDAVEVPNGGPIIQGKVNIAKGMGFLDQKDNHLTWTPVGADISASADLGYTYGTFEFRSKDKDGKPVIDHGKYTSIWKKQQDGSWKVVLDMGNASPAQLGRLRERLHLLPAMPTIDACNTPSAKCPKLWTKPFAGSPVSGAKA
jgi:ketosteroid isomerase-like protein